jgi:hypothetical protein
MPPHCLKKNGTPACAQSSKLTQPLEVPEGHPRKALSDAGPDCRAEKAEQVHQAVRLLCDSAAAGDLTSAQALISWINQALGMPTERVEHHRPTTLSDLEQMDTAQLQALVAHGRQRRLALVKESQERDREGDPESTSMPLPMPEGG